MEATNANWETTKMSSYYTEQRPNHVSNANAMNFARQLRALGQALERFSFSAFEIDVENGIYSVVAKSSATEQKSLSVLRAIGGFFRRSDPTRGRPDRQVD